MHHGLIGAHFAPPAAGHVHRAGDAFRFKAALPEAVGEDEGLV